MGFCPDCPACKPPKVTETDEDITFDTTENSPYTTVEPPTIA